MRPDAKCFQGRLLQLSISMPLVRRLIEGRVPTVEDSSESPVLNPEIKRRYDDEIHDIGQARRELGPSAQGTHGRHSSDKQRGGGEWHDARERWAGANRPKQPRPGFQGTADRDRWAFHRGQGGY